MADSLPLDVLNALSHGSVLRPVWHLAPRERWQLFRDTLLGHVTVRGGMRTRDLPLDPVARMIVRVATAVQGREYPVGGTVPARFGDWLYLFSTLVEPVLVRSADAEDGAAHAAIRECMLELRQALGLGELADFQNRCPFHHRLLGVLGLSRQEWKRLMESGVDFGPQRNAARLGARICAAWRTPARENLKQYGEDARAWAEVATGAKKQQLDLFTTLANEKRVLATLKPIGVQQYIHRAKTHWMMRGASVWCAQSLAFARDLVVSQNDALLLSDTDALVSFIFPVDAPSADVMLQPVRNAWSDPQRFAKRFPRLAPYHPAAIAGQSSGSDPLASLPTLSLWRYPATSLLDLCIARIPKQEATETQVGWTTAAQPSSQEAPPCSFVEDEQAYVSQSPAWLEARGPRRVENYGWSALCWSLCGTTLRTHWHHGICAELDRNDYAMMPPSHGAWLESLKMQPEQLTFVKLDGDKVGDRFAETPIPSRPLQGLKLSRLVLARVVEATRQVLAIHDAYDRPKVLPVDLVYFGGDDIFFCLPGCYLETFLRGFGAPLPGLDAAPWDSNTFRYLSVSLPPGSDFQERSRDKIAAEFARANLYAALMLAPGLRELSKPRLRDDAALERLNAGSADGGYRCEWAPSLASTGIAHGFSLNLVRIAPQPVELA